MRYKLTLFFKRKEMVGLDGVISWHVSHKDAAYYRLRFPKAVISYMEPIAEAEEEKIIIQDSLAKLWFC